MQETIKFLVLQELFGIHQQNTEYRSVHKEVPLHQLCTVAQHLAAHQGEQSVTMQISHYFPAAFIYQCHQPVYHIPIALAGNDNVNVTTPVIVRQSLKISQYSIIGIFIQETDNLLNMFHSYISHHFLI